MAKVVTSALLQAWSCGHCFTSGLASFLSCKAVVTLNLQDCYED